MEVKARVAFSKNDLRVIEGVRTASMEWDGYCPHGQRDWTAIRRLEKAGVVESIGCGVCQSCDTQSHRDSPTDVEIFRFTAAFLGSEVASNLGIDGEEE
jgi:hypothetical protein